MIGADAVHPQIQFQPPIQLPGTRSAGLLYMYVVLLVRQSWLSKHGASVDGLICAGREPLEVDRLRR